MYITNISDSIGNNYVGIKIYKDAIHQYLNELKEILSEDDYLVYTKCQQDRDQGGYHITVINVIEYNSLSKSMGVSNFVNSLENAFKNNFQVTVQGEVVHSIENLQKKIQILMTVNFC